MEKNELEDLFASTLSRFNPAFSRDWIRRSWLFRAKYAQPVPVVNHSQNIPDLRTPLPGIYLASMSQVYPWDRGTNYAVEIGRRAARLIMEDV
jgi:protoporphyrinogen oxidase